MRLNRGISYLVMGIVSLFLISSIAYSGIDSVPGLGENKFQKDFSPPPLNENPLGGDSKKEFIDNKNQTLGLSNEKFDLKNDYSNNSVDDHGAYQAWASQQENDINSLLGSLNETGIITNMGYDHSAVDDHGAYQAWASQQENDINSLLGSIDGKGVITNLEYDDGGIGDFGSIDEKGVITNLEYDDGGIDDHGAYQEWANQQTEGEDSPGSDSDPLGVQILSQGEERNEEGEYGNEQEEGQVEAQAQAPSIGGHPQNLPEDDENNKWGITDTDEDGQRYITHNGEDTRIVYDENAEYSWTADNDNPASGTLTATYQNGVSASFHLNQNNQVDAVNGAEVEIASENYKGFSFKANPEDGSITIRGDEYIEVKNIRIEKQEDQKITISNFEERKQKITIEAKGTKVEIVTLATFLERMTEGDTIIVNGVEVGTLLGTFVEPNNSPSLKIEDNGNVTFKYVRGGFGVGNGFNIEIDARDGKLNSLKVNGLEIPDASGFTLYDPGPPGFIPEIDGAIDESMLELTIERGEKSAINLIESAVYFNTPVAEGSTYYVEINGQRVNLPSLNASDGFSLDFSNEESNGEIGINYAAGSIKVDRDGKIKANGAEIVFPSDKNSLLRIKEDGSVEIFTSEYGIIPTGLITGQDYYYHLTEDGLYYETGEINPRAIIDKDGQSIKVGENAFTLPQDGKVDFSTENVIISAGGENLDNIKVEYDNEGNLISAQVSGLSVNAEEGTNIEGFNQEGELVIQSSQGEVTIGVNEDGNITLNGKEVVNFPQDAENPVTALNVKGDGKVYALQRDGTEVELSVQEETDAPEENPENPEQPEPPEGNPEEPEENPENPENPEEPEESEAPENLPEGFSVNEQGHIVDSNGNDTGIIYDPEAEYNWNQGANELTVTTSEGGEATFGIDSEGKVVEVNGQSIGGLPEGATFTVEQNGSVTINGVGDGESISINEVEIKGRNGQTVNIGREDKEGNALVTIQNGDDKGELLFDKDGNLVEANGVTVEFEGDEKPVISLDEDGNLVVEANEGRAVISASGEIIEVNGVSINGFPKGSQLKFHKNGDVTIANNEGEPIVSISQNGEEAIVRGKWRVSVEGGIEEINYKDGEVTIKGENGELSITKDDVLKAYGRKVNLNDHDGVSIEMTEDGTVEITGSYAEGKEVKISIEKSGKATVSAGGYSIDVPEGVELSIYDYCVVIGSLGENRLAVGYNKGRNGELTVWIDEKGGDTVWTTIEIPEGGNIEYGEDGSIVFEYKDVRFSIGPDGEQKLTVNSKEYEVPEGGWVKINEDGSVDIYDAEGKKVKHINPDGTSPEASRPGTPDKIQQGCEEVEVDDARRAEINDAWDAYVEALNSGNQEEIDQAFNRWVNLMGGRNNASQYLREWLLSIYNDPNSAHYQDLEWYRQYQRVATRNGVYVPDPPRNN